MIEDPITHELVPDPDQAADQTTPDQTPDVNTIATLSDGSSITTTYHRCQGTESLITVADDYGLTPDALLELNTGNPAFSETAWPVGSFIRVK